MPRILLLFFTPTSNHNFFSRTSYSSSPIRFKPHIHHSLPTRHRNTTSTLSTLPKMDFSNGVLSTCLLTFSTTVCVLGLILGVVFVLIHRQREEQLLDDIYHTVCSAIEASDDAENCNCVNCEQRQGPRNYRVPNYSSIGSYKKRATAAQPATAAATRTTTSPTEAPINAWW